MAQMRADDVLREAEKLWLAGQEARARESFAQA